MNHLPLQIKPSTAEAYKWCFEYLFGKQTKDIQEKILTNSNDRKINEFIKEVRRMAEYEPTEKEKIEWSKEKPIEVSPVPNIDIRNIPPRPEINS